MTADGAGYWGNPYVVAWPDGSDVVVKSAQSLRVLRCSWAIAEALLQASGDDEDLRAQLRRRGVSDVESALTAAREADVLCLEPELAERHSFFNSWTWGPLAAALMFGYHTDSFADPSEEIRAAFAPAPPGSGLLPTSIGRITALPLPASPGAVGALARRRRSRRSFASHSIDAAPIAACLQQAFGLTGELALADGRTLPLTAAPSPGALNTYDAFLLSRNVRGLEAGTYRYLPQQHALADEGASCVPFDRLFGGQTWCAEAACAIILVADLRRQASRYAYPTAIAAALIEAGARLQLLLLQAEDSELSAVVVGMTGVGAFDTSLALAAGLPCETSMTPPVCAVLVGGREPNRPGRE